MEPTPGIEPGTSALRKHCSTIELGRQKVELSGDLQYTISDAENSRGEEFKCFFR